MAVADIRYKQLGYVALNVTDLEKSRKFYEELVGMQCDADVRDGSVALRCSDKFLDLLLVEGAGPPGLKRVGWEMESEAAYDAVRAHLAELELTLIDVPLDEARLFGATRAFRVTEPNSRLTLEFFPSMRAAPGPFARTHTDIARLGHIVLNAADRPATEAFFMNDLNFRVSDRIDGIVTFMRCFPNPYHHSLGIGAGSSNGLNHLNLMVSCIDDIGKANNRMRQNGVDIVFGPGKHPPSESYFLYFLDPDGMTIEYSFGMEEFPEHEPRGSRDMPAALSSIDYWGGAPDPRFGKTGVFEALADAG